MDLKRRWQALRKTLQWRRRLRPGGKAAGVLRGAACFLYGFLLGRLRLPADLTPLGPGFAAACGGGIPGAAAAAGVMAGAAAGFGPAGGLRTAAVALLVYACQFLLRDWRFAARRWFAPLTAAVMSLLIGAVYLHGARLNAPAAASLACETVLAAGCCLLFRAGLDRPGTKSGSLGLAALAAGACMGLMDLRIAGVISVGRSLAALCVLTAARAWGAPGGGLGGLLLGLGLDAAAGTPGVCALTMGCAGGLGGLAESRSRLPAALGAVCGNAAAAFWAAESILRTGLLYEFFIASVLFLLLPEKLLEALRPEREPPGSGALLRYQMGRTGLAAAAFQELNALLRETPEPGRNDEDVLTVFDVAAEEVCRGCTDRERCWGRDYESTRSAMQAAWGSMSARGSAAAEDFPTWFREHCRDIRGYTAAVSRELKALTRRRQMKQQLRADRALLDRQYADFASVLRDLTAADRGQVREDRKTGRNLERFLRECAPGVLSSAFRDWNGRLHVELSGEGKASLLRRQDWLSALSEAAGAELTCPDPQGERLQLYEREPLEAEVGVAACCRRGRSPSGDVTRSFKSAEGILYLIVADGMGSGPEAAAEGGAAAALAEKLLRAGIEAETVMRILNTALMLRSEKRLSSLSMDLMSVNLFSGEACVYKYGAAPSYVRSGGRVHTVRGESPAAGTDDVGPDCTRLHLSSGSAAVILSDGAARAENVGDKLLSCTPGKLRELAGNILTEAAARGGWEDDMTVLTLSLTKRGEPGIS